MNTKSIGSFAAISAVYLMIAGSAGAQTETQDETQAEAGAVEENGTEPTPGDAPDSDEDFAQTLVGKTYSGSFELDGWTNVGGGLVLPPFYVQHYTRHDGTVLVLTAKSEDEDGSSSDFEVTDALTADKPHKGYTFSTACIKGEDFTLRYMGEVSGKDADEWWTNLRNAWEIDVQTGKISSVNTRGVKCTNPNW
ncbi:hypothetical protein [Methyloceanibacter caenitepidi]|uniref:Uncharacterized protein n=1 Tax=Methyloceanibacter caenitepidi TaxID=1384459 RepID=A0A0A8JXK8_9HYPH|nr:hypothetical protein [Methyloceanibacter caenitepidi]BAQ15513.1 hypothetical protein GL4_0042 [Methyloceanibacter caenitepidi]